MKELRYMTEYEKQLIAIEIKKVKVEWIKALLIFIPVLATGLIVMYEMNVQTQLSKATYDLKVAEIVSNSDDPNDALGKIQFIKKIYPKALPEDMNLEIDTERYTYDVGSEKQIKYIELYLKYPDQRKKIHLLWSKMFPGDKWLEFPVE